MHLWMPRFTVLLSWKWSVCRQLAHSHTHITRSPLTGAPSALNASNGKHFCVSRFSFACSKFIFNARPIHFDKINIKWKQMVRGESLRRRLWLGCHAVRLWQVERWLDAVHTDQRIEWHWAHFGDERKLSQATAMRPDYRYRYSSVCLINSSSVSFPLYSDHH